jgi:leucyl-tRNA synthetase
MMALLNDITATKSINKAEFKTLLILLNPFAPHITEELYQIVGFDGVLNEQQWVTYDEALCIDQTVEIVVQVNGKIKTKLTIPVGAEKDEVLAMAKADEKVQDSIQGKNVLKEIYVPNKLVNFVAK